MMESDRVMRVNRASLQDALRRRSSASPSGVLPAKRQWRSEPSAGKKRSEPAAGDKSPGSGGRRVFVEVRPAAATTPLCFVGQLVQYMHRLEENHAEMSMRLASAEGKLRSADDGSRSKAAEKIKKLEYKLWIAEGLAEDRAKKAADVGKQLQEAEEKIKVAASLEGMLRTAKKQAEERAREAADLEERLQRAEDQARVAAIEVEGARDWARSAKAKLADVNSALEERRVEFGSLREALEKVEAALVDKVSETERRAVEVFYSSSKYTRDLSEASADAYALGFEDCLAKVSRRHLGVDLGGISLVNTPFTPQTTDSPISLPPPGDEPKVAATPAPEVPTFDDAREA